MMVEGRADRAERMTIPIVIINVILTVIWVFSLCTINLVQGDFIDYKKQVKGRLDEWYFLERVNWKILPVPVKGNQHDGEGGVGYATCLNKAFQFAQQLLRQQKQLNIYAPYYEKLVTMPENALTSQYMFTRSTKVRGMLNMMRNMSEMQRFSISTFWVLSTI